MAMIVCSNNHCWGLSMTDGVIYMLPTELSVCPYWFSGLLKRWSLLKEHGSSPLTSNLSLTSCLILWPLPATIMYPSEELYPKSSSCAILGWTFHFPNSKLNNPHFIMHYPTLLLQVSVQPGSSVITRVGPGFCCALENL